MTALLLLIAIVGLAVYVKKSWLDSEETIHLSHFLPDIDHV
ncbi:hypothetical protein [Chromobacterium sp. IIBBL 290-4]|nr:hypothetical protein [Chromobacterium sp. IIBBL 290-4]